MYKVFLNTIQVKEYLSTLTTYGLLRYDAVMRRFRITGKGLEYLKIYDTLGIMTEEKKEYTFH
jgi:predicted transcriptional regulator